MNLAIVYTTSHNYVHCTQYTYASYTVRYWPECDIALVLNMSARTCAKLESRSNFESKLNFQMFVLKLIKCAY